MSDFFVDKAICITGGTGSLGTAIIHRLYSLPANLQPARIVCLSRRWQDQERLRRSLNYPDSLRCFIGDVQDKDRVVQAFAGIDYVIHAAALKSVPDCEYNPLQAIQINVWGTANVLRAAIDNDVRRLVLIGTDKGCLPINTYGKCKSLAESLAIQYNTFGQTEIAVARYGNVWGSSGSVLYLFSEQAKTRRVTITDPKMSRFWITLDQAVDFVLNVLKIMQRGCIYVPDLPAMNVTELAKQIAPGAEIVVTGRRPGEKLHEILMTNEETSRASKTDVGYEIRPEFPFWGGVTLGQSVSPDFVYTSASAARLDQSSLANMIKNFEEMEHVRRLDS